MQADWAIWGGMLGALLLSGVLVAAWLFPGWWQGAWRGRAVPVPGLSRLAVRRLGRRGAWWWGGLLLLCLPAAVVMAWSRWHPQRLDGFDDATVPANAQVAQLLLGEHLVPPPPVPPDVFLAADIVAEQPFLATADRPPTAREANGRTRTNEDVALLEAMMKHASARRAPPSSVEALQACAALQGADAAVCRAKACVQHPTAPACHSDAP